MPFTQEIQEILVVEDNDDDFEATERALSGSSSRIKRCRDGLEALQYLKGCGEGSENGQLPGLILLDLNMPGLDGRRFLERMKNYETLRLIPVVIMTTSNDVLDVQKCYDAGANTYVCKPVQWREFNLAISRIRDYWLDVAVLPDLERNR
jgi:CheY-like chemotaxis protein